MIDSLEDLLATTQLVRVTGPEAGRSREAVVDMDQKRRRGDQPNAGRENGQCRAPDLQFWTSNAPEMALRKISARRSYPASVGCRPSSPTSDRLNRANTSTNITPLATGEELVQFTRIRLRKTGTESSER